MEIKENSCILFFGDSVTDAGGGNHEGHVLPSDPYGKGYVRLLAGMFQGFYPKLNIFTINSGIGGNTTRHLLARFDTDVAEKHPDIIFIMIGVNDAWRNFDSPYDTGIHISVDEYDRNIREIITKSKNVAKEVFVMSPYLLDANKKDAMRAMVDTFGQKCKSACEQLGATFIDIQAKFDEYMQVCHPYVLSWDRVHPDVAAQMIIAREVMHALGLKLD